MNFNFPKPPNRFCNNLSGLFSALIHFGAACAQFFKRLQDTQRVKKGNIVQAKNNINFLKLFFSPRS